MKKETATTNTVRPPIVVVMGHIDHGKSTLLDYIRKTNVTEGEAGGITQHLSAYEVSHKDAEGAARSITFLDTPGHEAFQGMRSRGAQSADIAILVVSAEDSVKAQTIQAWNTIIECNLPYVVAINKIDRPNANPEKVKLDLAEKGIYLEGYGGDIPCAEISAKTGAGIDHLLELILLVADISELSGNPSLPAEGVVIESHLDTRRGITATLIVRNGTLSRGMFVACGRAVAGTRIMEDFRGKTVESVSLSQPVGIVGWSEMPEVGMPFLSYEKKSDAEAAAKENASSSGPNLMDTASTEKVVPIIIRTDTAGTADAVVSEIKKLEQPSIGWKIISAAVGTVSEADIKAASIDGNVIIVGFNTKMDAPARELNEQAGVTVKFFDIIYKLSEYLAEVLEERRPRVETTVAVGTLKVQKVFLRNKDRQVLGGLVTSGEIALGSEVRIMRGVEEIGRGTLVGLEQNKNKTKSVAQGLQCGGMVETRTEIQEGDIIESIKTTME